MGVKSLQIFKLHEKFCVNAVINIIPIIFFSWGRVPKIHEGRRGHSVTKQNKIKNHGLCLQSITITSFTVG